MPDDCVFCDIVAGKFGTKFVYEDDVCVAFSDLKPMAPTHVLVVPREHHAKLQEAAGEEGMLGRLLSVATRPAASSGGRSRSCSATTRAIPTSRSPPLTI